MTEGKLFPEMYDGEPLYRRMHHPECEWRNASGAEKPPCNCADLIAPTPPSPEPPRERCPSTHPEHGWQCGDDAGHDGDHTPFIPTGVRWPHAGTCSRCKQPIAGFRPPDGGMTAGYYVARAWQKYANPGEVYICDRCMWTDPRYIADYGSHAATSLPPEPPREREGERKPRHRRETRAAIDAVLAEVAHLPCEAALELLAFRCVLGERSAAASLPPSAGSGETELDRLTAFVAGYLRGLGSTPGQPRYADDCALAAEEASDWLAAHPAGPTCAEEGE